MKKINYLVVLFLFTNINLSAQMDTIYNKYGNISAVGTIKKVGVWYSKFKNRIPYEKMTYLKQNKAIWESYGHVYRDYYDTINNEIVARQHIYKDSQYLVIKAEMKQFYTSYSLHGKYFAYYQNGNIKVIEHHRKGVIINKKKIFYESGELKTVSSYKSYREGTLYGSYLQGKYYSYYENGQIIWKGKYKKDGKIGIWSEYYEDGKLKSIGNFNEDIKPIEVTYKNVSDLKREYPDLLNFDFYMPYVLNFKSGEWKYYDNEGRVIKKEFYEKGKLVKTTNCK